MSLLRRLLGPETGLDRRALTLAELLERTGAGLRSSSSSVSVTTDKGLRLGAVWSCVNLIADTVGGLPVGAFRKTGKIRTELLPTPTLLLEPSSETLALDWYRTVLVSLLLDGNAFGIVTAVDGLGYPTKIELIRMSSVKVRRLPDGRVVWKTGSVDRELWPLGDLWHLPAYTVAGQALGLSPITYAAETIGIGLASRRFGAQWFEGGAHPTGILQSEQEIGPEVAELVKERFVKAVGKGGEPAVLGKGLAYEAIQVAAEESQFLETSKANVADVARYYNIPPEMIGGSSGSSLTYANIEQRSLDLLVYGLSRWVLRLEAALSRLLPRGQFARLNTDAIVRVDLLNRYRAHDVAIRAGWKSRDEVRALEDLPPIPEGQDGDAFLWPPYSTSPIPAEAPVPADDGARSLLRTEEDR